MQKQLLISGANDGSVTVWDLNTKEIVANFASQHNSKVNAVSCSPLFAGQFCSVGTDQKVNIYSQAEKKCSQSIYCENPL